MHQLIKLERLCEVGRRTDHPGILGHRWRRHCGHDHDGQRWPQGMERQPHAAAIQARQAQVQQQARCTSKFLKLMPAGRPNAPSGRDIPSRWKLELPNPTQAHTVMWFCDRHEANKEMLSLSWPSLETLRSCVTNGDGGRTAA